MMKLQNVVISGIDFSDANDFCDAYIEYAEDEHGIPLTEEELTNLPADVVYMYVLEEIY
jgi:hypothetical protein